VRHIVELTGDELEVKYYERLLPLEAEKGLSGSPTNVMSGTFPTPQILNK
jgi:hypothetical protein